MAQLRSRKKCNEAQPVVTGAYTNDELLWLVGRKVSVWYSVAGQAECKCGTVEGLGYGHYGDGSPRPEHDSLILLDPSRKTKLEYTHSELVDDKWKGGEPPAGHVARREKGVWLLFRTWRADGKQIGTVEPLRHFIPVRRIQKVEERP